MKTYIPPIPLTTGILLLMGVFVFFACKGEQSTQTMLKVTSMGEPTPIEATVDTIGLHQTYYIDYKEILVEQPTKDFKPMSMYPGIKIRKKEVYKIDVSKLPKDVQYKDLSRYAEPITGTVCSGNKTCEFVCGKTRYIITGIPNQCECKPYEGGLDIWCRDGCNSYELSCLK